MSNTSEHPIQEALMKNVHLHTMELKQKNLCPCPLFAATHNALIPQVLKPSKQFLDQISKHGLASVQMTQN